MRAQSWWGVAVILLSAASLCCAQSNTSLGTVIDVTQPIGGCATVAVGDGITNDFDAFNCRLLKFTSAGGTLFVPSGTYKIAPSSTSITPVSVPPNVTVKGTGYGSVLSQPSTVTQRFIVLRRYSALRDIQLIQDQPAPAVGWVPNSSYDWQVWAAGRGVNIDNVLMLNPYLGVLVLPESEDSIGQVWINNLRGQPLNTGLYIDRNCDISRFEDIHFWPFWTVNKLNVPPAQFEAVASWTQAHGTAIMSLRNDNPFFSNVFAFRYGTGVLFYPSAPSGACYGVTHRPRFNGFECDACNIGVNVLAPVQGIEMTNVDLAAGTSSPINISGDYISATFTNMDVCCSHANVLKVVGSNNSILVSNSTIRSWNVDSTGSPAFQIVSGSNSIMSLTNVMYNNGNGAALKQGTTINTTAVYLAPGLDPTK